MEDILNLIFYIATGLSVLTLVFVWLGEIKLAGRRFRWYFYLPHAIINTGLGVIAPTVLWNGLMAVAIGDNVILSVLFIILWTAGLIGNNLIFLMLFRKKEDFSHTFFWCAGLTGLFILAFWIVHLLPQ